MLRSLPPAHRLARINYPPRALAFAFSLLALEALTIERGIRGWVLFFGVLQFLAYPHPRCSTSEGIRFDRLSGALPIGWKQIRAIFPSTLAVLILGRSFFP